jgi:hypothetical protein
MAGHADHKLRIKDQDRLRAYIRTEMILDRFQRAFFREPLEGYSEPVELSDRQIALGKELLAKSLPNLTAVEFTGDTAPRVISAEAMDEAAWARHYAERELTAETPTPSEGGTLQ